MIKFSDSKSNTVHYCVLNSLTAFNVDVVLEVHFGAFLTFRSFIFTFQKLIRLCGLPDSQTEKEEALFLFAICSRVKKDSYVLNYILEVHDYYLEMKVEF